MKRYFISLVAALVCSASAFAVIATPEPVAVTQADGSVINVKLVGDEFHSYYTLLDGTPVRRTEENKFIPDESVAVVPQAAQQARRIAR